MFKKITITLLLGTVCLFSLSQEVESKAYNTMLKKLLAHSIPEVSVTEVDTTDKNIIFLDAREKNEYSISHIKGAIWVGYDNFNMKRVKHIPTNSKIIIYCSVGYRSEKIGEKLIKKGFSNVTNLYGSIFEWVNQDYPVYTQTNQKTKKVHAYNKIWGTWLKKGEKVYTK